MQLECFFDISSLAVLSKGSRNLLDYGAKTNLNGFEDRDHKYVQL